MSSKLGGKSIFHAYTEEIWNFLFQKYLMLYSYWHYKQSFIFVQVTVNALHRLNSYNLMEHKVMSETEQINERTDFIRQKLLMHHIIDQCPADTFLFLNIFVRLIGFIVQLKSERTTWL